MNNRYHRNTLMLAVLVLALGAALFAALLPAWRKAQCYDELSSVRALAAALITSLQGSVTVDTFMFIQDTSRWQMLHEDEYDRIIEHLIMDHALGDIPTVSKPSGTLRDRWGSRYGMAIKKTAMEEHKYKGASGFVGGMFIEKRVDPC